MGPTAQSEQAGPAAAAGESLPEFRCLLACCTAMAGGGPPKPDADVEWPRLLELAEQHDVVPLVYAALSRAPERAPAAFLDQLRLAYQHNAQRNLRFTLELGRVLDCLERRGVEVIPYKGPTLAETVYGDVALRRFSDLDVLVRAGDMVRARAALSGLGYVRSKPHREAEERAILATGYECAFDGPAGKNLIELQWRLLPRFYAVDLEMNDLFHRAGTSRLGEREVRCLSAEDLLLALCLHAAKHAWVRLSWLCDIAATVRTQVIDYGVVWGRAEGLGVERMVGVSLWLVSHLLGTVLPESAQGRIGRDPKIAAIGRELLPILAGAAEYDTESPGYFRLMMRVRERQRDRLRFLWRLAVTPGEGEWSAVRLPEALFPLYRIVRLGRLARKLLSSGGGRG